MLKINFESQVANLLKTFTPVGVAMIIAADVL